MILSDKSIMEYPGLEISPLSSESIQPASVDIRLGDSFKVIPAYNGASIGFDQEVYYEDLEPNSFDGTFEIPSHSFVLATTVEYIKLPDNIAAFVEGRSSIGRMGLFIENAGWIDPGFEGEITLELYNAGPNPIRVRPGDRVGQIVFCEMTTPALNPYCGKYQGQRGATGSKKFMDKKE